jgi:hypothetical protein
MPIAAVGSIAARQLPLYNNFINWHVAEKCNNRIGMLVQNQF